MILKWIRYWIDLARYNAVPLWIWVVGFVYFPFPITRGFLEIFAPNIAFWLVRPVDYILMWGVFRPVSFVLSRFPMFISPRYWMDIAFLIAAIWLGVRTYKNIKGTEKDEQYKRFLRQTIIIIGLIGVMSSVTGWTYNARRSAWVKVGAIAKIWVVGGSDRVIADSQEFLASTAPEGWVPKEDWPLRLRWLGTSVRLNHADQVVEIYVPSSYYAGSGYFFVIEAGNVPADLSGYYWVRSLGNGIYLVDE